MTIGQIQETAATVTLWDIGAEFDDIHAQFHHVRNMLYIFDENLEREIGFIKKCKPVM